MPMGALAGHLSPSMENCGLGDGGFISGLEPCFQHGYQECAPALRSIFKKLCVLNGGCYIPRRVRRGAGPAVMLFSDAAHLEQGASTAWYSQLPGG